MSQRKKTSADQQTIAIQWYHFELKDAFTYIVDELDASCVAYHVSSDCYSQLKGPLLLNGEEEPNDNPEEQVEDGADDTGQHSTIKAALVDKGIVVKQRPIAHWNKKKNVK